MTISLPCQSPAPCSHLRIKASVTKHGTDSGIFCALYDEYVTSGRLGTCVLCESFDEAVEPWGAPWPGETA